MIITFTTDFGNADGYVGAMKGVILGLASHVTFVDISHDIPACDVVAGGWVLNNSYRWFPTSTIHMCIVDPGVGSDRRALIVRSKDYIFVAPDNGLLSTVLDHVGPVDCFWIDKPKFWAKEVSNTFHGRDVFAPIVGNLATGRHPSQLGDPIEYDSLVRLPPSIPVVKGDSITAAVVYIDRFGNLITNAAASLLETAKGCTIEGKDIQMGGTYSSVPPGNAAAYPGSHGFIEIGINQGRADNTLRATIGTPVLITTA